MNSPLILIPGDVVLYPEDSELSSIAVADGERALGLGKRKQYTHAGIVHIKPGDHFQAVFPWARVDAIDASRTYEIWRLCELDATERQAIIRWCDAHVGSLYALPLMVPLVGPVFLPGFLDCSESVCLAYASIGKHPGDAPMSPDSLALYPGARRLHRVEPEE